MSDGEEAEGNMFVLCGWGLGVGVKVFSAVGCWEWLHVLGVVGSCILGVMGLGHGDMLGVVGVGSQRCWVWWCVGEAWGFGCG